MQLTRLGTIAILAVLCLMPALQHSSSSSALAHAHTQRARGSAPSARRTYGHDDDDDGEETQQRRRTVDSDDSSASQHTLQLRMLHALGAGAFSARGDVTLNFAPTRGARALTFSRPQTLPEKKAVSEALQQNALYRVKFVQAGEEEKDAITASMPLCALLSSHFHEQFLFHVDPHGRLLSVGYKSPLPCSGVAEAAAVLASSSAASPLHPKGKVSFGRPGEKAKPHIRPHFDTAAQAAAAVGADAPPPPVEQQRNADGSLAPKEQPQSFWSKYWMYIVPVGIFVLLQAVVAPPEQGAPGGAGAGGAAPKR